jgi:hypothetical protein
VRERLGHPVEHEPDTHPRAEHHRDPRGGPELGRLAVAAERDLAVAAEGQPEREDHEGARGQHERPAPGGDHAGQHRRGHRAQRVRGQRAPQDERDDQDAGDNEDQPIDLGRFGDRGAFGHLGRRRGCGVLAVRGIRGCGIRRGVTWAVNTHRVPAPARPDLGASPPHECRWPGGAARPFGWCRYLLWCPGGESTPRGRR